MLCDWLQRQGHHCDTALLADMSAAHEEVGRFILKHRPDVVIYDVGMPYASSWDRLELMESLQAEVTPFGIHTTIVNPGFFRTELLTEQSTNCPEPSIADYDERRAPLVEYWKSQNGRQSGDPAKLARALITIASQDPPPRRFIAGADAIATAEQKIADLKMPIEMNRDLSKLPARSCLRDPEDRLADHRVRSGTARVSPLRHTRVERVTSSSVSPADFCHSNPRVSL